METLWRMFETPQTNWAPDSSPRSLNEYPSARPQYRWPDSDEMRNEGGEDGTPRVGHPSAGREGRVRSQAKDATLSGPTREAPREERGEGPTGPTPDQASRSGPPYWHWLQDDPAIQQVFSREKKVESGAPIPSLGAAAAQSNLYGNLEREVRQGMERLKCSEGPLQQSGWAERQNPAPSTWAPQPVARPPEAHLPLIVSP